MFRRLASILFVLLLAALPALAEDAPAFSYDVLLMQTANNALMGRYGLTSPCFGLFDTEITHYGDAAIVRYIPRSRPHPSLTGEYVVLITHEDVHALWTHDDVDPSLWQSGDLNSPAWGVKQLTAYLHESSFTREDFDAPYIPQEQPAYFAQGGWVKLYPNGELTEEEIALPDGLARAALRAMYGLTEKETDEMRITEIAQVQYADGHSEWDVNYYHGAAPDESNYNVMIDGETHMILDVRIVNGGIG